MQITKKRIFGIATILGTIVLAVTISLIPNSFYLKYIGTENLYVFMFIIAFIGSISTFASIPYPLILISLVSAGGSPLILGLCSAGGVILSDTSTFFTVRRSSGVISDKIKQSIAVSYTHLTLPTM
jgi:hypothetical protein